MWATKLINIDENKHKTKFGFAITKVKKDTRLHYSVFANTILNTINSANFFVSLKKTSQIN